jgi:hypothetical protein
MDYTKIVEMAELMNSVTDESSPGADRLDAELERLTKDEAIAVHIASKLLAGDSFPISTNNPDRWEWVRSLAMHMGATVTEDTVDWPAPLTRLTVRARRHRAQQAASSAMKCKLIQDPKIPRLFRIRYPDGTMSGTAWQRDVAQKIADEIEAGTTTPDAIEKEEEEFARRVQAKRTTTTESYIEVHALCVRLLDSGTDADELACDLLGNAIRGLMELHGIPEARRRVNAFCTNWLDRAERDPDFEHLREHGNETGRDLCYERNRARRS